MEHLTAEYLDQAYLRIPEEKLVNEYRKAAGAHGRASGRGSVQL